MMTLYTVYKHVNLLNNKAYIGYTAQTIAERWLEHVTNAQQGKPWAFSRAIRKYGTDTWEHSMLELHVTKQAALAAEVRLIAEHQTYMGEHPELGYNMTRGGEGGRMLDEIILQIAAKLRGRPRSTKHRLNTRAGLLRYWANPHTDDTRREQLRAQNRSEEGRRRSQLTQIKRWDNPEEHKRMSVLLKGRKRSLETRQRYSNVMKALWQDADYRSRMLKVFKHKRRSAASKQKQSQRMTGQKRGPYKNRGIKRGPRRSSVVCRICGETFKVLHARHLAKHGLTRQQYNA